MPRLPKTAPHAPTAVLSVVLSAAVGTFLALVLVSCESGLAGPPAAAPQRGADGSGERAAAAAPTPVAVTKAHVGTVSSHYTATATLEVEKQAVVLARATGLVESIAVEEGDLVTAGDELLRVANDEYRLKLEQTVAREENLELQFGRLKEISEGIVSVEEFETARQELRTATAEAALARLGLSYTTVTAPFDGRVVRRLVDVGQNISIGDPLFEISDFDPLLARVHVPAKELRKLQTQQQVTLVLDSTAARLRGSIWLISPTIDPKTGTVKVTVQVPEYPAGTRPGDFAEVRIVTDVHEDSTLVPRGAVFSDRGELVAFVVADDVAHRRVVEVGFTDGEYAEILAGIAPGDPVVVKGQRSLKPGMAVRIVADQELPAPPEEKDSP